MGYTHFWYRPQILDGEKFEAAAVDFERVFRAWKERSPGQTLTNKEFRGTRVQDLEINSRLVYFNGGCETFMIGRISDGRVKADGLVFEFCKTAALPYDLPVMCCLLVFKHHFGDGFKVSSNGRDPEWTPAYKLVKEVLDYPENWRFSEGHEEDGIWVDSYLVAEAGIPA